MSDQSNVHPSPHRDRVSVGWLFVCLTAAPLVWLIAFNVNEAFSSYACYPGATPLPHLPPDRRYVSVLVPLLYALAFLIAVAGGLGGYRYWRITRHEAKGHTLDIGEGRTRFMGAWSAMFSSLFALLLLFNLIAYLLVPPCAG